MRKSALLTYIRPEILEGNIDKLSRLFERIKHIYKNEGPISLIKRTFNFLGSLPFEYRNFYLWERELIEEGESGAVSMPKISNVTYRNILSIRQLDELIEERSKPSSINVPQARYRLGEGAIGSFIFVGKEFAHYRWMAMTEMAKNSFNDYPYKVDFENGEACSGDVWTNPKYRRMGLYLYAGYKRRLFQMNVGVKRIRYISLIGNEAVRNAAVVQNKNRKHKSKIYARARYIRLFGLKFWKETPIA